VNKKNNWEEIARVFILVKVWLKRSLDQSEGEGMGRGHVQVEEQAVEGKSPVHPPSDWPRLLLSQTFTCINTLAISTPLFFFAHKTYDDETQCSKMSAHKIRMLGDNRKERKQYSQHNKSLKPRMLEEFHHLIISNKL
jgi:hypothetical protein